MARVDPSRRHFLQSAGAVTLGFVGLRQMLSTGALAAVRANPLAGYGFGPLVKDPAGILDLPEGFSCRIISRVGETMEDAFSCRVIRMEWLPFPPITARRFLFEITNSTRTRKVLVRSEAPTSC